MPSTWDDWDDEPKQNSSSAGFDDWDEKPKKPTRKPSFTDTWGDDDEDTGKNGKTTTYFDDDWDVEPKKNTKPVYDDWDDEPTTKKSTPVDDDDWDVEPKKSTPAMDDWDEEPVKSTKKSTPAMDDWDEEPVKSTTKKSTPAMDDWDEEPVKSTTKKSTPAIDDWDEEPVKSTKQTGPSDFSFDDWDEPAQPQKKQQQEDPFGDWSAPAAPTTEDWDEPAPKKSTLKTTHVTNDAKTKVYKKKLSLAEMEAQKYNIRGKKGRIHHQVPTTQLSEEDDDDWDDSKTNKKNDEEDDFDWSQPVHKPIKKPQEEVYDENQFSYDAQWQKEKQSKATLGNIFSSIQNSYNNPQELKKNLYSAGKIINSAAGSMFSSLSNWVSNTVSSLNTDTPIEINGKVYQIRKTLGEGGFAIVYLATEHKENDVFSFNAAPQEEYAIKKIICKNESVVKDTEREIHILQACKHKFVLNLMGYTSLRNEETGSLDYYLLTPYYPNGTVWSIIEYYNKEYTKIWPFNEKRCLTIFKSVCLGVKHMHEKGYCHRDIKPHNIMLTTDSHGHEYGVLIDLGSARPIDIVIETRQQANDLKEMSEKYCSAAYRAPELYDPRRGMHCIFYDSFLMISLVGECLDVWSLGCTLYAMAFGTSPFESPIEGVMTLAILDGKVPFPANNTYHCAPFSKPFCKFIKMMLNPNYEERIDLEDVLNKTDLLLERCD